MIQNKTSQTANQAQPENRAEEKQSFLNRLPKLLEDSKTHGGYYLDAIIAEAKQYIATPVTTPGFEPDNIVKLLDVKPKPYRGRQRDNTQGIYNAEIRPRESIRIWGTMTNRIHGPVNFDKTFKIGDRAEYDSFNMIYVGDITTIGGKIIGIKDGDRLCRLDIYGFIDRNFDFSEERINKHNADESQCI